MIIIKDVPGLTTKEILEALIDITSPNDQPIVTGYGGFVVSEDIAERFLSAYLIASGKRPAPTVITSGNDEPTESDMVLPTPRRGRPRKEVR